jgi:DNA-binding response OmpR family regulator
VSHHLLVVEDEQRIADFLLRGLREEGYTVDHVADGRTASAMLRSRPWDLVLLDWWLPGEDGIQILRRFREEDRATPVLFLTARDSIHDRVTGLDAGADDYLCKPFSFEELLARVRALLRRPAKMEEAALTFQDIRIDLATQKVTRAGHPIDLTAKEFSLLVYLMRNAGKIVSRTRIYESVWDENYDGLSNTLEVHIKEIRRKLEAWGPRLIQTRRGRGYLLDAAATDEAEGGES